MAIPTTHFFLRELHSVAGEKWGGLVRLTPQLRRNLQWWTHVPNQSNGKPFTSPSRPRTYTRIARATDGERFSTNDSKPVDYVVYNRTNYTT
jgi:hypothetical protein